MKYLYHFYLWKYCFLHFLGVSVCEVWESVKPNSTLTIFIWSASYSLDKLDELSEAIPDDEFFDNAWMIGDDLGDFVYYYAKGNEGFGLYRDEGAYVLKERKK